MGKNRTKQKENRRAAAADKFEHVIEEKLDGVTECGIKDPTPREAVNNIIMEQLAS